MADQSVLLVLVNHVMGTFISPSIGRWNHALKSHPMVDIPEIGLHSVVHRCAQCNSISFQSERWIVKENHGYHEFHNFLLGPPCRYLSNVLRMCPVNTMAGNTPQDASSTMLVLMTIWATFENCPLLLWGTCPWKWATHLRQVLVIYLHVTVALPQAIPPLQMQLPSPFHWSPPHP